LLLVDVLERDKVPGLVLHHRPGERQERQIVVELEVAESDLPQAGVLRRRVLAGAVAVELRSAPEELEDALEVVAARLREDVDRAALRPAELRRRAGGFHLDRLDRLDVEP